MPGSAGMPRPMAAVFYQWIRPKVSVALCGFKTSGPYRFFRVANSGRALPPTRDRMGPFAPRSSALRLPPISVLGNDAGLYAQKTHLAGGRKRDDTRLERWGHCVVSLTLPRTG